MKKIFSLILLSYGFFVFYLQKVNRVALSKYKTYCVRRKNTGILSVGCETYWNNINHIHIGKNTYINGAELITTDDSEITIGNDCLISYQVVMRTDMHRFSDVSRPIILQGNSSKSITIGDDVWIGYGVYIMPGVTIGNHVIIGAKSVVTKDIPDNSVAVGVPAKVIKNR